MACSTTKRVFGNHSILCKQIRLKTIGIRTKLLQNFACVSSFKSSRSFASSTSTSSVPTTNSAFPERLGPILQAYEDFVGLTEVKDAQNNVIEAEKKFLNIQENRRQIQEDMSSVQSRLKLVSVELDKTYRGDDKYLELVKNEHTIIREEHAMIEALKATDKTERECFAALSAAVRESHEKERARAERTKYWSIIGSIIGATIGITGTTINNYLRMKELRGIVSKSAENGEDYKNMTVQLVEVMGSQYQKMDAFLRDIKSALGSESKTLKLEQVTIPSATNDLQELSKHTEKILKSVQKQELLLDSDIKEIKKLLGIGKSKEVDENVIYVGPEIEDMLKKTEDNIERKMKLNSLATVTFIYGALALTLPIIYSFFSGGGSL